MIIDECFAQQTFTPTYLLELDGMVTTECVVVGSGAGRVTNGAAAAVRHRHGQGPWL